MLFYLIHVPWNTSWGYPSVQAGVKDEKSWKYPISHDPAISIITCLGLMIMQDLKMYLAAHVFFELQCHIFQDCVFPQDSVIPALLSVYIFVVAFFLLICLLARCKLTSKFAKKPALGNVGPEWSDHLTWTPCKQLKTMFGVRCALMYLFGSAQVSVSSQRQQIGHIYEGQKQKWQ